jgi:hypothetical protein
MPSVHSAGQQRHPSPQRSQPASVHSNTQPAATGQGRSGSPHSAKSKESALPKESVKSLVASIKSIVSSESINALCNKISAEARNSDGTADELTSWFNLINKDTYPYRSDWTREEQAAAREYKRPADQVLPAAIAAKKDASRRFGQPHRWTREQHLEFADRCVDWADAAVK